ncbi:histidine kinase, partial [Streptomyces kebangsaanensis]
MFAQTRRSEARRPREDDGEGVTPAPPVGRLRSLFRVRSVAGQVFLLQVVVVLLITVAALVALVVQARDESAAVVRQRSMDVAETLAYDPGTLKAMTGPHPTAVLQPVAEKIMKGTDVDLVVVFSKDGVRYTHPDPAFIGKPVLGPRTPPRSAVTRTLETTQGRAVVSYVPVTGADGTAVGTVAVGITVERVTGMAARQLPLLLGAGAGVLVL